MQSKVTPHTKCNCSYLKTSLLRRKIAQPHILEYLEPSTTSRLQMIFRVNWKRRSMPKTQRKYLHGSSPHFWAKELCYMVPNGMVELNPVEVDVMPRLESMELQVSSDNRPAAPCPHHYLVIVLFGWNFLPSSSLPLRRCKSYMPWNVSCRVIALVEAFQARAQKWLLMQ